MSQRHLRGVGVFSGTGCPSLPLGMASPAQAHTGWHLPGWGWGSSGCFRSPSLCLAWDCWQAPLQRAKVFWDLMAS